MIVDEIWKPIPETCGFYEASNLGVVRSMDRNIKCSNWYSSWLAKYKGRILKPYEQKKYLYVNVKLDGTLQRTGVHRLVLLAFIGPPRDGDWAAHLNGNSLDNRIENLIWATPKENSGHKKLHGTYQCGEQISCSKLTKEDILVIRKRRQSGETQTLIAADFGVAPQSISAIILGKNWNHIK